MDEYSIQGTPKTPTIRFNLIKGELEMYGISIAENSVDFYKPLLAAIDMYASSPRPFTTITLKMNYFNTSSSKRILDIFKKLELINKSGSIVTINWLYEEDDDDMLEAGKDYESVINLTFKMVPVKEE